MLHIFLTFAVDTFFNIEPQKRSRLTKLGAQTQHRMIKQFVPPASTQSEITCARDKCVVFHNIGQAISGSTGLIVDSAGASISKIFVTFFPTGASCSFLGGFFPEQHETRSFVSLTNEKQSSLRPSLPSKSTNMQDARGCWVVEIS